MKTVRTRVKSAFKRNTKGTPAVPPLPVTLPAASTSAPSILLPEDVTVGTPVPPSPVTSSQKDHQFPGFRLESEPEIDLAMTNYKETQDNSLDLSGLKFTGDEPERVYTSPQPIMIKDDSRHGTPKKRIKSVPRLSSDYHFPSPSIASRIQTTLPPSNSNDPIVNDIRFDSPVDPNYLIEFDFIFCFLFTSLKKMYIACSDIRRSEPSLLDQKAPTDPSFVEATPMEVPLSLPPLHEILEQ